jgi:hypothetical protein
MSSFDRPEPIGHDDDLDRALFALPLEEPPPGLHARIMAATVYRPEPFLRGWEIWVVGTLVALAAWLSWLVGTTPHAAEQLTSVATEAFENTGLASSYTLLWLAVGASAAWWISLLTFPSSRGRTQAR